MAAKRTIPRSILGTQPRRTSNERYFRHILGLKIENQLGSMPKVLSLFRLQSHNFTLALRRAGTVPTGPPPWI